MLRTMWRKQARIRCFPREKQGIRVVETRNPCCSKGLCQNPASEHLADPRKSRVFVPGAQHRQNQIGPKSGASPLTSPDLVHIEAAIDQLSFSDQLWLMERLARRIRERSHPATDVPERSLEEMANDPAIQRELREIEAEFALTGFDGWNAHL
jgi:hypothetical protein